MHEVLSRCALQVYEVQPNSFNSVQPTERTRNCIYLCYKGNKLKNKHARVMVIVHDASSHCAL